MMRRSLLAAVSIAALTLPATAQQMRMYPALIDEPANYAPNELGSWTPGLPLIGAGDGTITQGTKSGTSTLFPVVDGTTTNGQCAVFTASGGLSSIACSPSGSGTVGAGNQFQKAYYSGAGTTTSVVGLGFNSRLEGPDTNNVVALGADPTGAVASTAAFNAALSNVGSGSGSIYVPCGKYQVAPLSPSVSSGKSLTIIGGGSDCTEIYVTTGTVLATTIADSTSSFHYRDFTVATQAINAGTGLSFTQTTANVNPANSALNDITNVTVRGDDGYALSDVFAQGIVVNNAVNNINFTNVNVPGSGSLTGFGVVLQGNLTGHNYGVAYNFTGCYFNFLNAGMDYGDFIQGVSITTSNFVGSHFGIVSVASAVGTLAQLNVTVSSFNSTNANILLNSPVGASSYIGNTFLTQTNNASSITGNLSLATIDGNTFTASGTNTSGVVTASGTNGVVVTGNTFSFLTTGVFVQGGSSNVNVQSNEYVGVTNPTSPASGFGSIVLGGGSK